MANNVEFLKKVAKVAENGGNVQLANIITRSTRLHEKKMARQQRSEELQSLRENRRATMAPVATPRPMMAQLDALMANRTGMMMGGSAGQPQEEVPQVGATQPVVSVGGPMDQEVTDEQAVADDVPVDVEEGTFVINEAAKNRYGIEKLNKLFMKAYETAKEMGIDISSGETKISKEDVVKLAVSDGEILVPKVFAQIIGYQTLENINELGEKETEERLEKAGEEPQQERMMAATGGDTTGFIEKKNDDTEASVLNPDDSIINYHYNTIKENKVGRDPEGRPVTVYSTSVPVREGQYKGKFALVPGYFNERIHTDEDLIYKNWAQQIDEGLWPIDNSGEESAQRAQRIHEVMDRDADTMPQLQ